MRPFQLVPEPELPETLGEVRWLDAHSLRAFYRACPHEDVLNVEALPDATPLSWFVSRFVCKRCGHSGAYVLAELGAPGVVYGRSRPTRRSAAAITVMEDIVVVKLALHERPSGRTEA